MAAVVALVAVVLFLPGLTLVGMEHVLHMALVLGAVVLLHRHGEGELARWPRWLPYLLVGVATFARLETAFVAAGAAVAALSVVACNKPAADSAASDAAAAASDANASAEAAALASSRNRARKSGSRPNSGRSSFTATSRSSWASRAR